MSGISTLFFSRLPSYFRILTFSLKNANHSILFKNNKASYPLQIELIERRKVLRQRLFGLPVQEKKLYERTFLQVRKCSFLIFFYIIGLKLIQYYSVVSLLRAVWSRLLQRAKIAKGNGEASAVVAR